jgi:hypothetical protein
MTKEVKIATNAEAPSPWQGEGWEGVSQDGQLAAYYP